MRLSAMLGVASCMLASGWCLSASAVDCGMSGAFVQHAGARSTPVWSDARASSLFYIVPLEINTDGTRRSYSVDDFWGERVALNNLCNAMSDACRTVGLSEGESTKKLQQRRELTQEAARRQWPADLLAQSRIDSSIIAFDGKVPCKPVDGFLVSQTALRKRHIDHPCDLSNYTDALVTPALVLPGDGHGGEAAAFKAAGARVGDLVAVVRPGLDAPVFAVVGDIGPADKFGEGSIALNGALLGKRGEPANYKELTGRMAGAGGSWSTPPVAVLVFSGTRNVEAPWMTRERIEPQARQRFEAWGGMERLRACTGAYLQGR